MLAARTASARADKDHEAACCATDAGQRANALREQAHTAKGADRHAIELLQQAVACFPPESDSVGRAAALHDLAHALDAPVAHPASPRTLSARYSSK